MRIYKIKVNGKTFEVKVIGITEVESTEVTTAKAAPAPAVSPATQPVAATPSSSVAGKAKVEAPMQGTILNIKVKTDDKVKAGDTLLILEAMKLENEIKAPSAGTIAEVCVSKGQQVNAKDLLIVIA